MPTLHGTLDTPLAEAGAAIRHAAAAAKYAVAEGESTPQLLVLRKGASLFSWGSELRVELTSTSPTSTGLAVTTKETFALTDWGRGKRAVSKLFAAAGATLTPA